MASSADNWADDIHPQYFSKLQEDYEASRATRAENSAGAYTLDHYQEDAGTTAVYPNAGEGQAVGINYLVLKLNGEAGEIAEKWAKHYRGDYAEGTARDLILAEIGDVLWYVASLATEFGIPLSHLANANLCKLRDRQQRGTIRGSGDTR